MGTDTLTHTHASLYIRILMMHAKNMKVAQPVLNTGIKQAKPETKRKELYNFTRTSGAIAFEFLISLKSFLVSPTDCQMLVPL